MLDNKKVYKNGKYISVTPHFAGTSSLVSVDGTATIIKTMSRNTEWSRAFDDDVTTYFRSGISEPVNRYIGLSFVEPCVVTMYHLVNIYNSSWSAKTFYLAARNNDSEEWIKLEDEHTVTKDGWTNAGETGLCFQVNNSTAYTQYAIFVTAKNSTNSISFSTIEFYKDDVMNNMTFVKCLESNTPQEVTGGDDKVFLTDEGNIYISKKDGSLKKMGGASINDTDEESTDTTLSAKKISDFLVDYRKIKNVVGDITDLNELVETGVYTRSNWTANYPTDAQSTQGAVYVEKWNDGWVRQEFTEPFSRNRWVRILTNGTWSAWSELATMDKVDSIPLIYNQNTDILAYALTCPQAKRTLVRIHSTNATNNPFGVTSDTDFIYEISKIDSANTWISVKAKDVRTNREFLNTNNDGIWLGWQELTTKSMFQYKDGILDITM